MVINKIRPLHYTFVEMSGVHDAVMLPSALGHMCDAAFVRDEDGKYGLWNAYQTAKLLSTDCDYAQFSCLDND